MTQRLTLLLLAFCLVQCGSVRTTEAEVMQSSQTSSTFHAGTCNSRFDIQLIAPHLPQTFPLHSFLVGTDTVRIIGTQCIAINDTTLQTGTQVVMSSDTTTKAKIVDDVPPMGGHAPWLQLFLGFGALFLLIYILSRPR